MSYGVYYDPEKWGLEIVGSVQWGEPNYSFDLTVVWRNEGTGQLYYADDSGCSCPSPFDGMDIHDLTPASEHEVLAHLAGRGDHDEAADLMERLSLG
jgi:hypothetical protein